MKIFVNLAMGLIFLSHLNLNSVTNQEHFLSGNQLYQQAQFSAALNEYQAVSPKNSALWYNMGNCAYHLEQYLEARLFWKRAQLQELKTFGYATKLARTCAQNLLQAQTKSLATVFKIPNQSSSDISKFSNSNSSLVEPKTNNLNKSNLSKLNNLNSNKFAHIYNFILIKVQQILVQIPLIILQLLFLLGLMLFCLVSLFKFSSLFRSYTWGEWINNRLFRRLRLRLVAQKRDRLQYKIMFLLLFLNLILAWSIYFKYNFMQQDWAIVTKPNLALQIGPGENYPAVGHLGLAEFVKILGQNQQNWYAVQSEDGLQVGWTAADGLTKC